MNQFCKMKGILRQFSVARTPQQNGVAERRNMTLIEAARTMLADSKLPTTFWAEAVNTACYVQNRVLVVKPHNKTPYELFHGRTPTLSFMRPFRCPVTILNTIDHLGKFDGSGPDWLFDIDALTRTMNYEPIVVGTQSNGFAGTKASDNADQARKETEPVKNYILLLLWTADPPFSQDPKSYHDDGFKPSSDDEKKVDEVLRKDSKCNDQEKEDNVNNTNNVNKMIKIDGPRSRHKQLDTTIQVSPIPTTRIHKDHPLDQVIGYLQSATQTRHMSKNFDGTWDLKISNFPDRVYKVEKALYRLHQAPRAWHKVECFLIGHKFKWIISSFGLTKKELCNAFEKLMHEKFQMSSMRELTFFLGLQLQQKKDGIFISQDKYVMIGLIDVSLIFKIPDIKLAVCARARNQLNPKFWSTVKAKTINEEVQLHALVDGKKIIVTKSTVRRELQLEDAEGKGFSGRVTPLFPTMVVQNQSKLGEGSTMPIDPHHTPTIIESSTQPQKTQKPRKPKRKDTQVPQPSGPTDFVADEAVHKELGDSLVRTATIAFSLEAEQDSGNITKTRSKAIPNESSSLGTTSGGGPRRQETIGDTIAQTRFENVSKLSNDSLLARGNTLQSDEDRLKLNELMEPCTKEDEDITLVNDDADKEMFDVDGLNSEEVFVVRKNENVVEEIVDDAQVSTVVTTVTITTKEVILAQALEALKTSKPKVKGIVFQERLLEVRQNEFDEDRKTAIREKL
ncbi:putative ribonuclease H-like domain-containing protein [Tanacetum coccineum]|uniref:Ribonuclease H-like domain-containing protein n=1 Tax=Tanacetum coccineum TaxID=301880 RepID=A0ABQ5IXU6_9ASTR